MSEEKFIPISDPKEAVKALNQITEMYNERGLVIKSLQQRIKELEEKLYLYEWKDIKDAPRDRLVLVDSSNITNRRAGENVALASWFYYDGLACWRDDNNEKIEPQPHRYMEFTPPTAQEGNKE